MKTINTKENLENAVKYYKTNTLTINECSKLFNCDRHRLSELLKEDINQIKIQKFIEISNLKHNFKYDYSLVKHFNIVKDKVQIICSIHGIFEQEVYSHKKGFGCAKCGFLSCHSQKINSKEQFIAKTKKVHGELYDYTNSNYINNSIKINILCKLHGEFLQRPNDHLQKRGCHVCAKENIGWTKSKWKNKGKNRKAKVYIIKCFNEKEEFIKIGRTFNTVKKRFASKCELPYKYEIIRTFESYDYDEIWDKEIFLHRKYKEYKYIPEIHFEGKSECFKINILKELQTIQE